MQKKLGPAWTGRGRPSAGYLTKRLAEDWLRATMDEARRGVLPGMIRTGATFADAAAEYLRYIREDRARKASTVEDYRSILRVHLLPAFGEMAIESVTAADVEAFQAELGRREHRGRPITARTKNQILNVLSGVSTRARKFWGLTDNPVASVERHPQRVSGDIEVYAPEEVWALVRAAEDERDASIFLTAAFTGLRMGELRASRWRDVDFAPAGAQGAVIDFIHDGTVAEVEIMTPELDGLDRIVYATPSQLRRIDSAPTTATHTPRTDLC